MRVHRAGVAANVGRKHARIKGSVSGQTGRNEAARVLFVRLSTPFLPPFKPFHPRQTREPRSSTALRAPWHPSSSSFSFSLFLSLALPAPALPATPYTVPSRVTMHVYTLFAHILPHISSRAIILITSGEFQAERRELRPFLRLESPRRAASRQPHTRATPATRVASLQSISRRPRRLTTSQCRLFASVFGDPYSVSVCHDSEEEQYALTICTKIGKSSLSCQDISFIVTSSVLFLH